MNGLIRTSPPRRRRAALLAAAGTLIVMACGGSPAAEPVSPEPTPPAADTAAPPPEPPSPPPEPESPEAEPEGAPRQSEDPAAEPESPPPASEDPPAEPPLAFDVDRDTVWEDVFDALTAAEQTCISGELDDDLLRSVLERRVLSESGSEQWEASIFGCLTPDNARSLFLGAVIEGFREDLGVGDLSGEEMSCLRDWVANIDVAALVAADVSGADDAEFVEPMMGVMGCVAVPFLAALFADMGVDMEDLSEDELSCLRQWQSDLADADWAALASGGDGIAALGLLGLGPMGCIPDRFVAVVLADMGVDTEDLSEDQLSCLQQWLSDLADADWASLDELDAAFERDRMGSGGLAFRTCSASRSRPGVRRTRRSCRLGRGGDRGDRRSARWRGR